MHDFNSIHTIVVAWNRWIPNELHVKINDVLVVWNSDNPSLEQRDWFVLLVKALAVACPQAVAIYRESTEIETRCCMVNEVKFGTPLCRDEE